MPETDSLESLRYPIGRFVPPTAFDIRMVPGWLMALEALPKSLDVLIENLDAAQLEMPYRPGGWTMNQTIHHLADSHLNAFIRLKLCLTEEQPVVKPYQEALWAETPEISTVPVNVSITLLHALHRRWVALLRNLNEEQWHRSYFHPEHQRLFPIWEFTALYAWHGRHHVAQLQTMKP
ncbi:MAG: putative metal-dependent hydrolase [Bacteroidetes bacterium]|nr:putative metal-dependent hydrolase [Bacteroidota bacterium]